MSLHAFDEGVQRSMQQMHTEVAIKSVGSGNEENLFRNLSSVTQQLCGLGHTLRTSLPLYVYHLSILGLRHYLFIYPMQEETRGFLFIHQY